MNPFQTPITNNYLEPLNHLTSTSSVIHPTPHSFSKKRSDSHFQETTGIAKSQLGPPPTFSHLPKNLPSPSSSFHLLTPIWSSSFNPSSLFSIKTCPSTLSLPLPLKKTLFIFLARMWCFQHQSPFLDQHLTGNPLMDTTVDETIERICTLLPRYQGYLKSLITTNHQIIGYVRKSKGTSKDDESRIRLLTRMCEKMKQRSFTEKVFASCAANARDPISYRDHKKHDLLSKIPVDGDMQDMLGYISS
ncbi:hypothetical protein [Absidia glauca]|uniref:Uncharacterized protein n=1 Tax=Absidia glauca TaxID=4829 RepID=A0A163JKT3_ABSGL|nr:hypothetical protein [Absidia glauca]